MSNRRFNGLYLILLLVSLTIEVGAQSEDNYYKLLRVAIPEGVVLEAGGICTMPNGNIAVSTRRGDIYIVENPMSTKPVFRKFAEGLHEVLGLKFVDNSFYCAQRSELTKVSDTNGDGKADAYETVFSWPLSGNYHEYSYGPVFDEDGYMYVTLNLGFFDPDWWRGRSKSAWRGWTLRISPEGEVEPWATGMRSPCGIGIIDGEFFYADNQGDWIGSGSLVHVEKGDFTGNPGGLAWSDNSLSPLDLSMEDIFSKVNPRFPAPDETLGMLPDLEEEDFVSFYELEDEFSAIKPPAVWLPHGVLGTSTSDILTIDRGGAFGPFEGQVLIGDQGQSKISRVMLEKVKGEYQGASILFREGFSSGVLRMTWGSDNSLFVGQTNRGWGSTGPLPYALERLVWTGTMPFEIQDVKAKPDGFELFFTEAVDLKEAQNSKNYSITNFIYKYHPVYGSPAVNQKVNEIVGVKVADDRKSVRIVVEGLKEHYIHEITADLKNDKGNALLHPTAYYTLNNIPEGEKLALSSLSRNTQPAKPPVQPAKKSSKKIVDEVLPKHLTKKPTSWGAPDQTIKMLTKPGLKYAVEKLTVKAGARIRLDFENPDDMPHNLLIVLPETANDVGKTALRLGINGASMNYVPDMDEVLFHTKLLQPGEKESIFFVAPTKPGTYTYLCTYPGHYVSMRGILVVE